jgi:D-alanine transaminase
LARHEGLTVQERYCSEQELLGATEVFLTGTTVEVLGVVHIDGKQIGKGQPGPLTRSLAKRFLDETR